MVNAILTISVDSRKVENMLNGYVRTIPKAADTAVKKIASMYAEFYLQQMDYAAGVGGGLSRINPWTGESFAILRQQKDKPIKLGDKNYGVVVPHSLVMLDSMRTHYVSLKRGRNITAWARAHGFYGNKIIVHRHPWIKSANIKAGKNIRKMAIFEIDKAIKNKGRG